MEICAQNCVQARNLVLPHCDTSFLELFNLNYISTIFYVVKILDSLNVTQMIYITGERLSNFFKISVIYFWYLG